MIGNGLLRIQRMRHEQAHILRFEILDPKNGWRTVLSHRAENKHRPWEKEEASSVEDMEVANSDGVSTAFFSEIALHDAATLVRRGEIPGHQIEERISVAEDNRLRVVVRDRLTQSGVQLSRLMNHYYFMPDNRAMGYALPLDFAWLPGLHENEEHVAGDWFFRSPCAIAMAHGVYAAIVPDLDRTERTTGPAPCPRSESLASPRKWRDLRPPSNLLRHLQVEARRPRADGPRRSRAH